MITALAKAKRWGDQLALPWYVIKWSLPVIVTTRTMGTGNESLKFNLRAQRMMMISSRLPREKQARKYLRAPNPDGLTMVGHCLGIVIEAFENELC